MCTRRENGGGVYGYDVLGEGDARISVHEQCHVFCEDHVCIMLM